MDKKTAIQAYALVENIEATETAIDFVKCRQDVFKCLPQDCINIVIESLEVCLKEYQKKLENM